MKEDIMYARDKRHSCGTIMPNLFFALQCMAIGLFAYMFVKVALMMQLSEMFTYAALIMVMGTVYYCLEKRTMIIHRQRFC